MLTLEWSRIYWSWMKCVHFYLFSLFVWLTIFVFVCLIPPPQYNRVTCFKDRGTLSNKVPHKIAQWSFSLTSRLRVLLAVPPFSTDEGGDLNSLSLIRLIFSFDWKYLYVDDNKLIPNDWFSQLEMSLHKVTLSFNTKYRLIIYWS